MAQDLAVALIVALAFAYVVHARAPAFSRRLRVALAVPMVREGRPAWLRALGRRLAPPRAAGGCAGCDGCAAD